MSLISGPGRGGVFTGQVPDEVQLVVEKHVKYIQSLDTVSSTGINYQTLYQSSFADRGKMNLNTG